MRKLKLFFACLLMTLLSIGQVWAGDVIGTINFGSASGSTNINAASVTGNDSQGNTWTVTTAGTTSFTPNASYAQIGSSSKPATSITFTTTLASEQTIKAFSAKFGGFSGTAGTVTLKVGDTSVGTGSLSASTDVTVNATNTTTAGTVLTVTITGISKGVKAYYISYTYDGGGDPDPVLQSIAVSGTPSTTIYEEGNVFDVAGLVVTGTYDVGDPAAITSNITWTACKTENGTYVALDNEAVALAKDETGIYIKATVSEITSPAFHVTGLTVTAAAPKITITQSSSGVSGSSYSSNTFTQGGLTFSYTDWMKSTNFIQAKKSTTGSLKNTTAIPGVIKSITVVTGEGNTARAVTINGGATAGSLSAITAPTTSMSMKFDFGTNEYYFFELNTPGNACYFDKIVIEYEPAPEISSIAIKTAPTKTIYTALENFDPAGLVLTVNYEGGTSKDVTYNDGTKDAFSFSPALDVPLNATHSGNVTVTYGAKTTTQAITVNRIATSLEWSQSEFAVLVGATSPSYPTLTKTPNDLTGVTYSSSDESVALIDENTGEIELGDEPGSSTITASFAQTDVYAAAEDATYTLTLSAATSPYLEVDPTALNFGDVAVDGSKGLDFTLSGSHLEADASLAITGAGASMFSVASSVAKDGEGAILEDVTVTYAPTAAGTHSATLTITSSTASATVALSGTAKVSHVITWSVGGTALSGDALAGVTTSVLDGSGITALPEDPDDATLDCANKFIGWSRSNLGSALGQSAPSDLFTEAENAGDIEGDVTFYAVFATVSGTPIANVFSEDFAALATGSIASPGSDKTSTTTLTQFSAMENAYPAGGAVKLGGSKATGSLTTRELTIAAESQITISFDVQGWTSVEGNILISSDNESFEQQTVSYTALQNAESMEHKSITVTASVANPKIIFATSAKRAFLDNIVITSGGENVSDYVTKCAAVAAPTFDPAAGEFSAAQNVTIASTTENAKVYYTLTTDGSTPADPTASSTEATGAITVNQNSKIKAIAIKGEDKSDIVSAEYTFKVATPEITGNTSFVNSATVTITAAEGTTIYYTDDESEPTTSSTQYTAPFNVTATKTIKAIAVKSNWTNSAVAEQAFTKITTISVAEAIELIPNTNDQVDDQYVYGIVCTPGTSVNSSGQMTYYISADGSETDRLQVYLGKNLNNTAFGSTSDLAVGDRVVVFGQLKNYKGTYEMNSGNYLVSKQGPAVATPVFTPDGAGFMGETDVTITCATEGNTIYYTTDGTTPSTSSTPYTAAIHLNATTTITAVAYVGDDASLVISKTFTLTDPMTVAAALEALDSEDPINNVAVTGKISTAPTANPSSGKLTYYISEDGTTTSELKVYNGLGLNGAAFSAKTDLQVGDQVTVFGNLTIYNTVKEFDADNRLLTFNRPTQSVTGVTLPETAIVRVGSTITLTPTIAPSNATNKNVSWSVISGDMYAEVSEEGVVTGLIAGGNAVIQVETEDGGYQATCTVTVAAARPTFTETDHEWIKISSASKLVAGRFYVIAESANGKTATTSITSSVMSPVASTFSEDKSVIAYNALGSNTAIFELGGNSNDGWTLYEVTDEENTGYFSGANASSFGWSESVAVTPISFDENGNAVLGNASGYRLLYNSGSPRFKTYSSATSNSMLLPQLYMWAELSHAVTFDANGGVAESVPGVERTDEGKIIIPETVPTHSDASKVFAGWYENQAGTGTKYEAGDEFSTSVDATLYAKWSTVPTYTVTYVLGGTGTAPEVTAYPAGRKVTVATVSDIANPGYLFTSWTVKDADNNVLSIDENNQFTMPAANVTITAGWERESSQKWSLVKHDDVLALNVEYVIASKPNAQGVNPQKALGTINTDNYGNEVSVKIADEILRGSDAMVAFTIVAGSSDGKYAFKNGTKYLQYSGTGNTLTESETLDNKTSWTIEFDDNDVATITNVATTDRFLQYNSGSSRFACYKTSSNQQNVQIYTKVPLQKVQNNETINSSTVTENSDVEVEKGGKLIVNANQKVTDMIVEAGGTVEFTGTNTLTINGKFSISATTTGVSTVDFTDVTNENLLVGENAEIFYDLTLGNGGSATQWHAFTVPFPVDAMNGVYDLNDNKLTNEVNYAIMSYHGDVRAQGLYGWKKFRGIMTPGTFYLMTVDGERTTYRFKKAAGDIVATNSMQMYEYAVSGNGEDDKDNGWNGVGNPNLFGGYVSYNVQMLNADGTAFVPVNAGENHKFAVGIPFFIQAGVGGGTMSLSTTVLSSIAARGTSQEYNDLKVTFGNENYTDKLFISAREDALTTYETGKDLVKMTMSSTPSVPQIFGKAYGHKLCIVDAPLTNNQAIYDLDLYAPAAGTYSISAQQVEGATLYVTYNGAIVWNLSLGDYELDLTRGTTTGYGLLLVAQLNQMPTGLDTTEGVAGDAVQKILLNGQLYILRDGHLFDAVGHEMK